MRVLPILAVFGMLLAVGAARAQWGGDWGRYHSSTAAEGYQRGFADVVRSAGAANLMNSAAAKNVEEARSQYIDNRLKATKTYFEMKRYNKDYKDATSKPRPTSEQLFRLAKDATPKRLSPAELDPVSGKITWPQVLQTASFATYRESLDALFADRANAAGRVDFEQLQAIRKSIRDLQAELRGQIRDIPPQVFSSTNSFLRQLEYEAQLAG